MITNTEYSDLTISIIMLVKNELHNLKYSIPILLHQKIDYYYEIIVIDSGSTDGSIEFIRKNALKKKCIKLFQLLPNEFHHARTRNLGCELAKGEIIVYLGGDAVPKGDDWLYYLIKPILSNTGKVAATYGKQIPRKDSDVNNICRMTYNYGERSIIKNIYASFTNKELYFFSSVNCSVDKRIITPPFFDENVPVNEDVTLSYNLINSGYSIAYCADSVVTHSHNYNFWDIFQRYYDNGVIYSKLGIFNKNSHIKKDGKKFLLHSIMILKKRQFMDWLYFGLFLICSTIGFKVGQNYFRFPKYVSKKISKYNTAK